MLSIILAQIDAATLNTLLSCVSDDGSFLFFGAFVCNFFSRLKFAMQTKNLNGSDLERAHFVTGAKMRF